MLVTKINLEVGEVEKHAVSLTYSKWTGKITIKTDDLEKETLYIVFGNEKREFNLDLGTKEQHHVNFVIYPGSVFWERPVIEISVDNNQKEIYLGNTKTSFQSTRYLSPSYQNQGGDVFKESRQITRILFLLTAIFLSLAGIAIPIVTAILHPDELRTNIVDIVLGMAMSFGLAFLLYIFSLEKPPKIFEIIRRLFYYAGAIVGLLALASVVVKLVQMFINK